MSLFPLGETVATPGALNLSVSLLPYFKRHASGDWGDMGEEDKQQNEQAIGKRIRIFSAYDTPKGRIWIITEADCSVTTALLPSEY